MKCKKLGITKMHSRTCVARQKIIARTNGLGTGKNWGYKGSKWLKLESCRGCAKGLKLYEKSLELKK